MSGDAASPQATRKGSRTFGRPHLLSPVQKRRGLGTGSEDNGDVRNTECDTLFSYARMPEYVANPDAPATKPLPCSDYPVTCLSTSSQPISKTLSPRALAETCSCRLDRCSKSVLTAVGIDARIRITVRTAFPPTLAEIPCSGHAQYLIGHLLP
jgi:hypothetical protein